MYFSWAIQYSALFSKYNFQAFFLLRQWVGLSFFFFFLKNIPAPLYTCDRTEILQNHFQVHLCCFFAQVFCTYKSPACIKEQVYEKCACMKGDFIY